MRGTRRRLDGRSGFGMVSPLERRDADIFFAALLGRPDRRRREAEAVGEGQPLVDGPLTESEWSSVVRMLQDGAADVGAALTADPARNALLVAGRIFCMRNALRLLGQDPLLCLLYDVTIADPRVRALVPHVTARGPLMAWPLVPRESRILYVMRILVRTHGFPVNGAAGLLGSLVNESAVLPQMVQGASEAAPLRAKGFDGLAHVFTAEDVMNRDAARRIGPLPAGVGLAQWTTATRRAALFAHAFQRRPAGARILFDMDAQVDFMVSELRSAGFAALLRRLTAPAVSVDDAAAAALLDFERPAAVLDGDRLRPRTDPSVIAALGPRLASARRAAALYSTTP